MVMGELVLLKARDVETILAGREEELVACVAHGYRTHHAGETTLPHSSFTRFPRQPRDRIIALPAWVGGAEEVAGIKWISSFPGNLERGIPRASAVLVLNSMETGRANAIMEAGAISASRTAASAALFAELHQEGREPRVVAMVGCGLINRTVLRFLRASLRSLRQVVVYDTELRRASDFADWARERWGFESRVEPDLAAAIGAGHVCSMATTALEPHVACLDGCPEGASILHISLRDIEPEAMLKAHNVVDDVSHVCRERTSIELAATHSGGTDFIDGTIGGMLSGELDGRALGTTIFSPFGLGVLDLSVGQLALKVARTMGVGTVIDDFWPA